MRKFFCTATVFTAMVGLIYCGFCFKLPATVWFTKSDIINSPTMQVWLWWWIVMNFLWPMVGLIALAGFTITVWSWASTICAKLRGDKHV